MTNSWLIHDNSCIKIILCTLLCIISHNLSAQDSLAFTHFMDMPGRSYSQGGACYGKYLFVGMGGNRQMDVYDLERKVQVGTMSTGCTDARCHANTLNFGSRRYKQDDEFPLLYVSSGSTTSQDSETSNVYVYRIERQSRQSQKDTIANFHCSLVQTISFTGLGDWVECSVDADHDSLWVATWMNGKRAFLPYAVPDAHQSKVTLTMTEEAREHAILVDNIRVLGHPQGQFCKDGHIYIPAGMPGEVPYLAMVSLAQRNYDYVVNLYEVDGFDKHLHRGNDWEQEYIFSYDGDYYLGFRHFIYRLNLDKVKEANYFWCRYRATH